MKTKDDLYMEDIHSIALAATELIEAKLAEYGITLDPALGEDDEIYVPLIATLDKYSNGDYRHHN